MADTSRKALLTADLLQLTQEQHKALEDAVFIGWDASKLAAYQKRGEQVSLLRQELKRAVLEEDIEVLPGTPPVTSDFDAEPS